MICGMTAVAGNAEKPRFKAETYDASAFFDDYTGSITGAFHRNIGKNVNIPNIMAILTDVRFQHHIPSAKTSHRTHLMPLKMKNDR